MMGSLNRVCTREELQVEDLDLVNASSTKSTDHGCNPASYISGYFPNIAQHINESAGTITLA